MRLRPFVLSLLLWIPFAQSAEPYVADPDHTRITFEVKHLGFSWMPGVFHAYESIEFAFDPENPAASRVDAVIRAGSVDMFHEALNEHLRSEDFFDVASHPTLRFESTEVTPVAEDTARVEGKLTLLGQTRPVTMTVVLNRHAPNPRNGNMTAGFTASGVIDRTAFGMRYGAPLVGSDVKFTINTEAVRAADLESGE